MTSSLPCNTSSLRVQCLPTATQCRTSALYKPTTDCNKLCKNFSFVQKFAKKSKNYAKSLKFYLKFNNLLFLNKILDLSKNKGSYNPPL